MRLWRNKTWSSRRWVPLGYLIYSSLSPVLSASGTTSCFATTTSFCMDRKWGVLESVPLDNDFQCYRLFMRGDNGTFTNNLHHPLLLFKSIFFGSQQEGVQVITKGGSWTRPWAWGIFPYHHYHSTAWELLLCVKGQADVQLGGESGPHVSIEQGDLIFIPPGFAHKQLRSNGGFTLLGAYPTAGCSGPVDTLRRAPNQQEKDNIASCVPPRTEPVLGLSLSQLY